MLGRRTWRHLGRGRWEAAREAPPHQEGLRGKSLRGVCAGAGEARLGLRGNRAGAQGWDPPRHPSPEFASVQMRRIASDGKPHLLLLLLSRLGRPPNPQRAASHSRGLGRAERKVRGLAEARPRPRTRERRGLQVRGGEVGAAQAPLGLRIAPRARRRRRAVLPARESLGWRQKRRGGKREEAASGEHPGH